MKSMTHAEFKKLDPIDFDRVKNGEKLALYTGRREVLSVAASITVHPTTGEEFIVLFYGEGNEGVTTKARMNTPYFRMAPKEPERRTVYLNVYHDTTFIHMREGSAKAHTGGSEGETVSVHLVKTQGGKWTVESGKEI